MDEHSTPLLVEVPPSENINDLLATRVAEHGDAPFIEHKAGPGAAWVPISAREFDSRVVAVAKGLVARGVEVGQTVGIMSRTRYEWTLLDFAIWAAGGVPVPLYETSSAEQVEWILTDADVRVLVVETAAHAAVVDEIRANAPALRDVLVIDEGAIETLVADGAEVDDAEIARRRAAARLADVATIIYTSGTTGRPKGAELTHGNFVVLSRNAVAKLGERVCPPGSRTLLFMPLAHVFARFIEILVVAAGATLGHSPDTKTLVADLGEFRPTFILSVPRVFEKVYNSSEQKAAAGGKGAIFQRAAKTAIVYSRALDAPRGPSPWLRLQHKVADVLVLSKIRKALGGQASWAISGGAPLGERLGHFYRGVGLHVLEGYGLTETTAPTSVNLPDATKIGTVGPPLPGCSIRVDDDGEVLVRGPHVFARYHDNPAATADAFVDGWFRTGDLGSLDADGFLRITGRKKEIIVTAGGKNVAPAVLEDRLRGHPLVSQVVVVGDAKPFIGALITLDAEALPGWLATHDLPEMDVATAAKHPTVLAALDRAVERTNKAVSRAESIRRYTVLTTDFTVENDYLTPSLKVKRNRVVADFTDAIEKIYSGAAQEAHS
ncbi:AMP-dependent synthetase/ligase [Cellulomonas carbonis]|uniref:Acyl-CoA synthetase n=1 Tax=Cellulomonas carbonis T26 TaxID=947969 RepID=A0A0A0BPW1_9CELL|nr:AMP-dependent synthetase/ligase [Cellulomonas carbonis]KGM10523.1 long-chain fatty acid--CoA ligase [Cellulomonas carbonis T26]GGB93082.1 long-chain-fatty-acid--CoA ligase [Cellulomonas carbonis]